MKVGIAGAGAVGCHYGSQLQQAGIEVVYLTRGEHLLALLQRGMTHISHGRAHHYNIQASDDANILAGCDVVILTCKTTVLEDLCTQIQPVVKQGTLLMTMQNGVNAPDCVAACFPEFPVVAASAFIGVRIEKPGVVVHSAAGHLRMGWWKRVGEQGSMELKQLLDGWNSSDVDAQMVEDMPAMLWNKLLWNTGFNAITALTRCYAKDIAADEDRARWVRSAMQESVAVAQATGVKLPEGVVEQHMALTLETGEVKTSMWQDLEHGRCTEIEAMNGFIAARAKEVDLSTPTNDLLASLVRAAELSREPH